MWPEETEKYGGGALMEPFLPAEEPEPGSSCRNHQLISTGGSFPECVCRPMGARDLSTQGRTPGGPLAPVVT